jgi:nucleotidyltransferase substrate binding protein (TIGR01987 family)
MNERALEELSNNLARALDRLAEALDVPEDDPLAVDGTIQRFEFTFELFWKTIQRLLAREGVEARSPKSALREAYRLGWLADEQAWLDLLEDRNLTSHTYREALALEIYRRIPAHYAAMRSVFEGLQKRPG